MDDGVVATAAGWTFEVRCELEEISSEVARVLRSLAPTGRPTATYTVEEVEPDAVFELRLDGELVGSSAHVHAVLNLLVWSVNKELARRSPTKILVHAAGVADGDQMVLLLGSSGAGKSTLVTGLVREGLTYVTDEAVALDRHSRRVHPFTRAITLKPGSWPMFPELRPPAGTVLPPFTTSQWHVDPADVGSVASPADRPRPAAFVLLDRSDDRPAVLETLSRAEALAKVLEQQLNPWDDPAGTFRLLADEVRHVACYRLRYGGTSEALPLVLEALGARR